LQSGFKGKERDFFKDRLSAEEVRALAEMSSADEMFSWNSPSARGLKGRRGAVPDEELIRLMTEDPRLIRRPMLLRGGRVLFGFKPGQYGT
jgi:arsenate reductase